MTTDSPALTATRLQGGGRRTRNRKGAGGQLREELLAAAGRLLDEGGDAALTMRAVARMVGAAPQSVYLHFPNREELLWSVMTIRFDELRRQLDTAEQRPTTPPTRVDRLRRRCVAYCAFALEHPHRYRLLLDRQAPERHQRPSAEFPGAPVLAGFIDAILDMHAGVVSETSPSPQDAFVAATDLVAILHGAVLLRTGLPSFRWPPLDGVIDRAISDLTVNRRLIDKPPRRRARVDNIVPG